MAKLISFMICERIENIAANTTMIPALVAPQLVLRPQYIPGNFSFGVAVGVSGVDLQGVNRVRFCIKSPDGKLLHNSGVSELPIAGADPTLPSQEQGFMICIDVRNLAVTCEGVYTFSFFLNDACVGEQPIPVYRGVV